MITARTEPVTLEGIVQRILYRKEESGYTVLQLEAQDEVVAVGHFPDVHEGERLRLRGRWNRHPRYGMRLHVDTFEILPPATAKGIERYLASGLVPGIGPETARKLVEAFGDQTLDVIANESERLQEVDGIGPKKAAAMSEAFAGQSELRRVMVYLQGIGLTTGMALRIYKRYGNRTVEMVREDPYRLADEVAGIGFRRADEIAQSMGIAKDSIARARAGVLHVLREATGEGHLYLPGTDLAKRLGELDIQAAGAEEALRALIAAGRVVADDAAAYYLTPLYEAEERVARLLQALLHAAVAAPPLPGTKVGDKLQIELADEQAQALEQAAKRGVLVITGGPGTGKTTVLQAICSDLAGRDLHVELAAPTGRAAQRLAEATGRPARTLHRLLEVKNPVGPGGGPVFGRNAERPIPADAVVVDEFSMVDIPLFDHLLQAIRPGTRLILVGDEDQLPSVGPGSVLQDVLASGCVPSVRLTQVFRQAATSMIVTNAHRIRAGELPVSAGEAGDFFFLPARPGEIPGELVSLIGRRLPAYLRCDPILDIQLVTPVRRGPLGVEALNGIMQEALNPLRGAEVRVGERAFRAGDKVMQVRNDYERMVFNGDIGRVVRIDAEERFLEVAFPDGEGERSVRYTESELDQLALAYAISVHKSQGSEYPCIVMPITGVMPALMTRNLLYTALTRARRLAVLIGQRGALATYVRNNRAARRYSRLADRLTRRFQEEQHESTL